MNEENNLLINVLQAISTKNDKLLEECFQDATTEQIYSVVQNLQEGQIQTLFSRFIKKSQTNPERQYLYLRWVSVILQENKKLFSESTKLQSLIKNLTVQSTAEETRELTTKSQSIIGKLEFISQ